ncbi:uncharacterized protein BDFB_001580 [Asbolus verrucosus]|uniref:Uncharacterized protein n=1 Tax=Asbolus verrucosus TaxID=1661398 RepID=A0A482W291_ASBVE|nr:uncharacterized protein BDFB_001580 [Asbolus verrucosus]
MDLLDRVLFLFKQKDWREVLELNKVECEVVTRKLLWVWPSESNLKLIKNTVNEFGLNGVISIGCGCGLFEWLLQEYSGLPVIGYEVNKEWWMSKYCNPHFIELNFPSLPPTEDILDPSYALLFCYFNNGPAFRDYVNCYNGDLIFIIGPGEGAGRHTDPEPFKPEFGGSKWTLCELQEVRDTKDFIAAYVREK